LEDEIRCLNFPYIKEYRSLKNTHKNTPNFWNRYWKQIGTTVLDTVFHALLNEL